MDLRSIAFNNNNKAAEKTDSFQVSDPKLTKFFSKNKINPSEIKYILRENEKTAIYLFDDRVINTYITANDIVSYLPDGTFYNINRGTYVALAYIANINQNLYTMMDGRVITGRAYHMEDHEENKTNLLNRRLNHKSDRDVSVFDSFSGMDNLPIAFGVIELLYENGNRNLDFVVRYCNKAMAKLECRPVEDLVNHSLYDIYSLSDTSRLVMYADVAINGELQTMRKYIKELDRNVRIKCFQPREGFCAVWMEDEDHPMEIKALN